LSSVASHRMHRTACYIMLSLLVPCSLAFAQDGGDNQPPSGPPPDQQSSAPSPGWHRFSGAQKNQLADQTSAESADPPQEQRPDSNQQPAAPNNPADNQPAQQTLPPPLVLKAGTLVTARVNQTLSSDQNRPGDGFTATLVQPLVVDGLVVAQRNQTVAGRVAQAEKAGRVSGVSRLALELTDLTLVDGQQVPIRTELVGQVGPKSVGRDAAAVAGTSAVGASVGAIASGGEGAAIGAGAGALAATIGVLLTRGRPTVIYPEQLLSFRLESSVTISTDRAPQAFRPVEPDNYAGPASGVQSSPPPPGGACQGYGCAPPPPPPPYNYYGYYYGPAYPYYWGPGFAFYYGPRLYYGPRYYYGRGFYGHGYWH
jgi:hypothetical protein